MTRLLKPCPFCGTSPRLSETFGRLVATCPNKGCSIKPSTWLTGGDIFDIRKLAKHWNQRTPEAKA